MAIPNAIADLFVATLLGSIGEPRQIDITLSAPKERSSIRYKPPRSGTIAGSG